MICDGGHPYLVHTFHALTLFRRVFYKNSVTEAISMNMKVQMEPNCPIGFSNLEKKFESSFSSGETIDVKTTEKLYTVIDRNQRVLHSSVQGYVFLILKKTGLFKDKIKLLNFFARAGSRIFKLS